MGEWNLNFHTVSSTTLRIFEKKVLRRLFGVKEGEEECEKVRVMRPHYTVSEASFIHSTSPHTHNLSKIHINMIFPLISRSPK
jgi:hypothetical protein